MKREVEELIDNAPQGYFNTKVQKDLPKVKQRLLKVADLMDNLGRLDEQSQEVRIDENSLRKLVREVSPGSENAIVEQLRRLPGSNLTKSGRGMKRITWETLSERMAPPSPPATSSSIAAARLSPYSSLAEIRAAVQGESPDIPDAAFDAETLYRRFQAVLAAPGVTGKAEAEVVAEALPSNVWDCMVRHFGFWGAIVVLAVAVVVLAICLYIVAAFGSIVAAGSPVFWELFWVLFWRVGWVYAVIAGLVAAIIVIVHCIFD